MEVCTYVVVRMVQEFSHVEDRSRPWEEVVGINLGSRHGTVVSLTRRRRPVLQRGWLDSRYRSDETESS
jgi:hypothetical protein